MENWRENLHKLGINASRSGKYTCPDCSHTRRDKKDKCLSVTFDTTSVKYKCHNCDKKGIIPFEENNFVKKSTKTYNKPKPILKTVQSSKLESWGNTRKISLTTLQSYEISFNDTNELVFPYTKYGELVNIKYRTDLEGQKKRFRQEAGTEKTFFGMDQVSTDCKELIIVEGEIDVLSFREVGLDAVSVPQGASEHKLECIDNCFEFLDSFDCYIIAVDSDEAGEGLKNRLIERLGSGKCKIVDWSKYQTEGKDANDFLMAGERGVLLDAVELAEYLPVDGVENFSSKYNSILDEYHKKIKVGLSTGWANLDNLFTIHKKHLMIITGIPTRGKSFFADNLLMHLSKANGWKHLFCSIELSASKHFRVLSELYTGKTFDKYKNDCMGVEDIEKSMDFIDKNFLRLSDTRRWSIDDILERAEYCVRRYGIDTLVIDPYNKLDRKDFSGAREDWYIDDMLSKLITFGKKNNILVIFIAHPKTPKEEGFIPNLYSISGGGSWYNMADYGIVIHRDRVDGELSRETSVIVQKVKDTSIGNPGGGTIKLMYDFKTRSLVESTIRPQSHMMKGLKNGTHKKTYN